ncbi:hypothetical protein Trydic_g17733 [Trypoxylus dichotomus]
MNCRDNCPLNPRIRKVPRHKLDQARRKLDFANEGPQQVGPSIDKYDEFKRVSESHSSQEVEPPMFTSSQLASVPDSFLEMFTHKAPPKPPPKRVTTVPYRTEESPEYELPESFLEFCRERIEINRKRPKSPTPVAPPVVCDPGYSPESPPGAPSYLTYSEYAHPDAQRGMLFDPSITSTPKQRILKSPSPYKEQGFYPFPVMRYYEDKAPSFDEYTTFSPTAASTPKGIGKYARASSKSRTQTPPCSGICSMTPESTVSSGDFFESHPKGNPSGKSKSIGTEHSTGRQMTSRREASTSSIDKSKPSDAARSDNASRSRNPCRKCPTLGVTPVQSGASFTSSYENLEEKQSIRRGIENELSAREEQERNQLEADLMRWQQARRNLVLNTASMGA